MAQLEYSTKTRGLVVVTVGPAGARVGRRKDLELVLESAFAAPLHFVVLVEGGHYVVVDQRTANGTFLNGRRLWARAALRDGDVLSVGTDARVVFRARP
ncbi:MAG: FHA domain-containing protein [Sandaracinaceae bacterium]|nr:FHA domain-containing protein [Sandaracinaceae bacterium]